MGTLADLQEARLGEQFRLEGTPYRTVENIGRGAYGVVCKALDTALNRHVAIKRIPRAFTAVTLAKRTLREVRILRDLAHENIVPVLDMFTAQGHRGRDIYLVLDLMEADLHEIIHGGQPLCDEHHSYFLYQILRGLKYIHSVGIVHRDLKPSNIFVNSDCLLKIGDFGMARSIDQLQEPGNGMTQYVSTRWYRAPELLFSMIDYDTKVDIWSAGCILGELITRKQLFPGRDSKCQVKLIVHYLGPPPRQIRERITSEVVKRWIDDCGRPEGIPWDRILDPFGRNPVNPKAVDIFRNLLAVAPWDRWTAEEALAHPFFSSYHDKATEPVSFDAEAIERLNAEELVEALDQEARHFETLRGPYNTRPIEDVSEELGQPGYKDEPSTSEDHYAALETPGIVRASEATEAEAGPSTKFTQIRQKASASDDEDDDEPDGTLTPVAHSSASSTASGHTVRGGPSQDENPSSGPPKLAAGSRSAPAGPAGISTALGRQLLKRALEQKIQEKEQMLRDALKLAYSQQNKRRRKSEEHEGDHRDTADVGGFKVYDNGSSATNIRKYSGDERDENKR
ncbi:unnamed protein product, partial [Mesorhabditis spiculigera]